MCSSNDSNILKHHNKDKLLSSVAGAICLFSRKIFYPSLGSSQNQGPIQITSKIHDFERTAEKKKK